MKIKVSIALLLLPLIAFAQKSVTEFMPAQRAALQAALEKNSSLAFVPETWFNHDALKYARTDPQLGFGKNFRLYYQSADFNKDGIRDFAVLVLKRSKTGGLRGSGLVALVFNGLKNKTYRLAHTEQEPFADARFINVTDGDLWVGLLESDDAGCFIPAGKGYIVEPCN